MATFGAHALQQKLAALRSVDEAEQDHIAVGSAALAAAADDGARARAHLGLARALQVQGAAGADPDADAGALRDEQQGKSREGRPLYHLQQAAALSPMALSGPTRTPGAALEYAVALAEAELDAGLLSQAREHLEAAREAVSPGGWRFASSWTVFVAAVSDVLLVVLAGVAPCAAAAGAAYFGRTGQDRRGGRAARAADPLRAASERGERMPCCSCMRAFSDNSLTKTPSPVLQAFAADARAQLRVLCPDGPHRAAPTARAADAERPVHTDPGREFLKQIPAVNSVSNRPSGRRAALRLGGRRHPGGAGRRLVADARRRLFRHGGACGGCGGGGGGREHDGRRPRRACWRVEGLVHKDPCCDLLK